MTNMAQHKKPFPIYLIKLLPIIVFALFQSCEVPADPYSPNSPHKEFGWYLGGEWKLDFSWSQRDIKFYDTVDLDCNAEKYNLYTTRKDSIFLFSIDTINWSTDSTYVIRWQETGKINLNSPNRPSACGGYLNKDSIIESTWTGKIDSFIYVGEENGQYRYKKYVVHLSNGQTPKLKLVLRPYYQTYQDQFINMEISMMFENDPKEYYRKTMFRSGGGLRL